MSVGVVNKQTGDRIPTAGMPAIDDALDLTSVNPVQNAVITAALANKQDKTDNNLQTTDKTVVGAVNELKSGLTNVDVALSVPDGAGKNILPMTVDGIKAANTSGTWSGNTYTYNDIVYTLVTDNDGNLVKITVNGTTTLRSFLIVGSISGLIGQEVIMNGGASGGVASYTASGYCLFTGGVGVPQVYDVGSGATFTVSSYGGDVQINVKNTSVSNLDFYPMIRLASVSDPTFAPYIPSVNSRLQAVESGLTNIRNRVEVAQSSTTGTYSQKINALVSAFESLPYDLQIRCFIEAGGTIIRFKSPSTFMDVVKYNISGGKMTINTIMLGTASYMNKIEVTAGGTVITDISATEDSTVFTMYYN